MNLSEARKLIRDVPDFPSKGIIFKDITPLLANPSAFKWVISELGKEVKNLGATKLVGIESRGFIFASALAEHLSIGLVLARKKGKLPWKTVTQSYKLEYGTDQIEMHEDSFSKSDRVVVVDDVLATGGTAAGAIQLCEKLGAQVAGLLVLIELEFLKGRSALDKVAVSSLIKI